jgi:hypothetical protein
MSPTVRAAKGAAAGPLRAWARSNSSFLIVLAVLLCTAAGLRKWVEREPVPWPEGVEVNEKFRMTSLPTRMGSFVMVPGSGADIAEDIMKSLMIGTSTDKERRPRRRSNWYAVATYRDERVTDERAPFRDWRLEMYYYTGVRDRVPHVPERCLTAAGATVQRPVEVKFQISDPNSAWTPEAAFQRTDYVVEGQGKRREEGSEYYVFSLNGEPENSWEKVRLELSYPWVKYCYFAKIQFTPLFGAGDRQEADRRSRDFVNQCLPRLLRFLPTRQDVDKPAAEGPGEDGT